MVKLETRLAPKEKGHETLCPVDRYHQQLRQGWHNRNDGKNASNIRSYLNATADGELRDNREVMGGTRWPRL